MEDLTRSKRLIQLVVAIALAGVAVGARLYEIQIRSGEEFRALAKRQQQGRVTVPAIRGAILDRDMRDLAVSVETESLFAHAWRVENPADAAARLADVIDVDREELERKLSSKKPFVYLRRCLSPEVADRVRELGLPMGGNQPFGLLSEAKRFYPRGVLGSHVIGFANIDGKGLEGIEKQYDHALQGDETVYLVHRDANSGSLRHRVQTPEKHPNDVVLTIDAVLQHVVERELDTAMRSSDSRTGSIILLDVVEGEILALANRPAADLNEYGKSTLAQRVNRAVGHVYEPGSTFKVVSMAAALEEKIVEPGQHFFCDNGLLKLDGRSIRDSSAHGMLSLREIFAKSSNIGMVKATESIKPAALHAQLVNFGFGTETGVELPGESKGILGPVASWSGFTANSLSFGHEISVTVLQMAAAVATVANDGVQIPPRVVRAIRDHEGNLHLAPRPRPRRVVSTATARELRTMMERVVTDGTGGRAVVPGYRVAGKTGTAQKPSDDGYSDSAYVASFGGYAPAGQPRLVALVVLDSPAGKDHQGGQVAAPAFSRVMAEALRHLRIPNDEDLMAPPVPRADQALQVVREPIEAPNSDGTVPDLVGMDMRAAVSSLASAGYLALVEGNGRVRAQDPAAGEKLAIGQPCRIVLTEAVR